MRVIITGKSLDTSSAEAWMRVPVATILVYSGCHQHDWFSGMILIVLLFYTRVSWKKVTVNSVVNKINLMDEVEKETNIWIDYLLY